MQYLKLLYNLQIGPYQVLQVRVRVNLEAIAKNGYIPQSYSITEASLSNCLILHPQYSLGKRVLIFWRETVRVFYSPSRLGHQTLVGGVLTLCRDTIGVFYSPSRLGYKTVVRGILPTCRNAVGVFYSPSQLVHKALGGRILPLRREPVGVFNYSSWLGHKTLVGGALTLCRDSVGVFYSPSRHGHNKVVCRVLPICRNAVGVFYSLPADLATGHSLGKSMPLQRYRQCVLQPQKNGCRSLTPLQRGSQCIQ